jgi:hypothetical protein
VSRVERRGSCWAVERIQIFFATWRGLGLPHQTVQRCVERAAPTAGNSSEFLKLLDRAYPPHTAIHLILDNHSAHISREIRAWLTEQPTGRFEFTFTPTWLLAKPCRAVLFQAWPFNASPLIEARTEGPSLTGTPWFTPGPISSTRAPQNR